LLFLLEMYSECTFVVNVMPKFESEILLLVFKYSENVFMQITNCLLNNSAKILERKKLHFVLSILTIDEQ
jgi:hypothetical protein